MNDLAKIFHDRNRTHVLMITNHGVHEWEVVPGLPDTGGQNVYVNQFAEALIAQGYRVTILNRGGYPHPVTGELQAGEHYHPSGLARIVYLEDGKSEFVRKEDMNEQLPALAKDLQRRLREQNDSFDIIISHYWDAGKLGTLINYNGDTSQKLAPHVWIPHSLGAIKKRNMDPSTWANLRIDERIDHERQLLRKIDGGVATSSTISISFRDDYALEAKYFLPPCVNPERYYPMEPGEFEPTWEFLAQHSSLSANEIKQRQIITEVSRTDKTKRKDVLIKAFAQVHQEVPEALLVVTIDERVPLYEPLKQLIRDEGVERDVIVLGSCWDQLPGLYNATSVYCTPSVMEGFGMSAQEAAATGKPVVSSNLVPFVCEYLLGDQSQALQTLDGGSMGYLLGDGGIVVLADFVEGFVAALTRLLKDDELRTRMGQRALDITIPYFTWDNRTRDLMDDLGLKPQRSASAV
ncbi:MAG: glycosyltransferase [Planctomycetota bacterium]